MPDFEAIVRHQQTTLRPATERLKVVEKVPLPNQTLTTDGQNISTLLFALVGGLVGSIIGTGLILYFASQELIDFKTLF